MQTVSSQFCYFVVYSVPWYFSCLVFRIVNGNIAGLVTIVETLAIDLPNGYIKVDGRAVLPEFQHCGIGKVVM